MACVNRWNSKLFLMFLLENLNFDSQWFFDHLISEPDNIWEHNSHLMNKHMGTHRHNIFIIKYHAYHIYYMVNYLEIHNKISKSKYFKLHLNPLLSSMNQRAWNFESFNIGISKLWPIDQIWPAAYCITHKLRTDFTFLMVGKIKGWIYSMTCEKYMKFKSQCPLIKFYFGVPMWLSR